MALPFKPQPKEVVQHWIDTIKDEASDKLSDKEIDFIESCQKGLDKYGSLTEKMQNWLESIYAEKTS